MYDLLKAQINPHFLFNSLNSLSSLISKNPSLADELEFIRSYGHLLKTRHGAGFRLQIDVDTSAQDHLLPRLLCNCWLKMP